jgi:hypothetical protein
VFQQDRRVSTHGRRVRGVAASVRGAAAVVVVAGGLVAGGLGAAGAGAEAEDDAFMRWAEKLAEAEHKTICGEGSLTYPASKIPGRFVWFFDKARSHANWIVFESNGRRWLYRHEGRADWGGNELQCGQPGGGVVHEDLELRFSEQSNISDTTETITFVDGDLVEVDESQNGYHDADRTSWIEGTHTESDPHPLDDSPEDVSQHMLFALPEGSRWWAKVPPAPVDVTFGAKRWSGKADADFAARVVLVPQGLKVELAATDDRAVLPPADADARAMVRADHFELWFCQDQERSNECRDKPAQLGVARTAGGGALARWLRPHPRGAPVPAVSVEKDRLVVILPLALVGAEPRGPGSSALVPFTVAYSDSDDPAAGQQTMVATAPVKRAKPAPPSLLAVSYGDRPFPSWPDARPLAKGEAIFAEDPECGEHAVARARAKAAAPLASGAAADAAARLAALVDGLHDKCFGRIPPETDTGMRIDLALARHKMGDDLGCLAALRGIYENLPPAAITRTRALCGEPCTDETPGCAEGKAARAAKK